MTSLNPCNWCALQEIKARHPDAKTQPTTILNTGPTIVVTDGEQELAWFETLPEKCTCGRSRS